MGRPVLKTAMTRPARMVCIVIDAIQPGRHAGDPLIDEMIGECPEDQTHRRADRQRDKRLSQKNAKKKPVRSAQGLHRAVLLNPLQNGRVQSNADGYGPDQKTHDHSRGQQGQHEHTEKLAHICGKRVPCQAAQPGCFSDTADHVPIGNRSI